MRVRLKGLHWTTKRLANGKTRRYYYAWRGGPPLPGKPGEAAFMAAYQEAIRKKADHHQGLLSGLFIAFEHSADFDGLAQRTRDDYKRHMLALERKFGSMPVAALGDRRVRAVFLKYRDEMARSSKRQADYRLTILARIIAWGYDRSLAPANPLERMRRLYKESRADKIWTEADERAFLAAAPAALRLAFILAIDTAQREGDLLRLPWSAYDGAEIALRQSKTGAFVRIPTTKRLKALLDETPKRATTILTNSAGRSWTEHAFRSALRKPREASQTMHLTFGDLRGTAVTRMALGGADHAQISAVTGHSLRQIGDILDRHYISRNAILAAGGIALLENEAGTGFSNQTSNQGRKAKS